MIISSLLLFVTTAVTATSIVESSSIDSSSSSSSSPLPSTTCERVEIGTAASTTIDDEQHRVCDHRSRSPSSTLKPPHFTYDSNTGSAQAYTPNAPIKNSVCDAMTPTTKMHYNYKVTNRWSPWRSVQKPPAPIVKVHGRLIDVDADTGSGCRDDGLLFISENDEYAYVEAWQALPDGTYSSLLSSARTATGRAPPQHDGTGTCRARVPLLPSSSSHPLASLRHENNHGQTPPPISFAFETYAPGVTGVMAGLGPEGWDIPPWKAPVIHLLTWLEGYQLSLIEIPIIPYHDGGSAEAMYQHSFNWGKASFHWNHARDELDVTVDINMRQRLDDNINRDGDGDGDKTDVASREHHNRLEADLRSALCQRHNDYSWWYPSSPQSFFMEPITLCRPYILDFFPL